MAKKQPSWLVPAILFSGAVAFLLWPKTAGAKLGIGNVQTATVGDRVYSVTKLGQGSYLVSLISTGGVIQVEPVNFSFTQTEQLGAIGPEDKLTQLKADMPAFSVDFHS